MRRIPLINGDEYDALTRAKQYYHWKAGDRRKIKRAYRRRERQKAKRALQFPDSLDTPLTRRLK